MGVVRSNFLAFDLDGVLVDLDPQLDHFAALVGATRVPQDGYRSSFVYEDGIEMSYDDMWEYVFFEAFAAWEKTPIMAGASELVKEMHELSGKPVLVVTARPAWTAGLTQQLVTRVAGKVPFMVAYAGSGQEKFKYLDGMRYYVEDRRRTAIDLASRGFITFLVQTHYNRLPNDLPSTVRERIIEIDSPNDLRPLAKDYLTRSRGGGTYDDIRRIIAESKDRAAA